MSVINVFESNAAISQALNQKVAHLSQEAIARWGKFTVAVSGGSLPTILSAELKKNATVDWAKWHVFLADERCVPLDHADSNCKLIKNELLAHVSIPANQVYPLNEEYAADPAKAAEDYTEKLKRVFGTSGFPQFDLILLGMGPDGHTCSLFPGHPLLNEKTAWVSWLTDSPKPPPSRITLTYPVLNIARCVIFVSTGESKAEVLHNILDKAEPYPSQLGELPSSHIYLYFF
ncbi:suppressor of los1-1 [Blyttiomyces sp. JEL0837]|nr:suppressor of los1-1 [Blyttiomyces sp. JEL0837]